MLVKFRSRLIIVGALFLIAASGDHFVPRSGAQVTKPAVASGKRYPHLVIRNATVIDGNGTPASGPKDIVIEGNMISQVVPLGPVALMRGAQKRPAGEVEIDAAGKYIMPGLINAHGHVQEERGGIPQPLDYELKIWLACGITTVRDVGSETTRTLALRDKSNGGEVVAPRLFVYASFAYNPAPRNADEARARVCEIKQLGADGIKLMGINRDLMAAAEDEAHKLGLRIAHHVGVEETNAWDDIKFGTTSIEHW